MRSWPPPPCPEDAVIWGMATSCHRGHLLLVTVGQGSSLPAAGRPSQAFSHGLPLHITSLGDVLMSVGDDTRPSPGRGSRDTLGTDQQGAPRRCHQDNFGTYPYGTPRRCHQDTRGTHEHPLGDTTPAPPPDIFSLGGQGTPPKLSAAFSQSRSSPQGLQHIPSQQLSPSPTRGLYPWRIHIPPLSSSRQKACLCVIHPLTFSQEL